MYLLEEAYEALEAIEKEQPGEICQELGDLLFQILFLSYMGEEKGEFDLLEVMTGIHEKMIRRHPHVFGSTTVQDAEEVSLNWAKIKKGEKKENRESASPLESIPAALPALLRAHRLTERASKAGLIEVEDEALLNRIGDSIRSLEGPEQAKDLDLVRDRMGDLLLDIANLARAKGFNAEDLLRGANQRFYDRFQDAEEGEGG
jgi:MazG family protein